LLTLSVAALITLQWSSEADDAAVNAIAKDFISRLEKATKAKELYYPYVYINDAMSGQEVFSLYGGGKSLPRLKAIRAAYDPAGVLANYENSGFKL
jgi:FAD/FMN-containing dehydrogenase